MLVKNVTSYTLSSMRK